MTSKELETQQLMHLGKAVLKIEAEAVLALEARIDEGFVAACRYMLQCEGRIVVVGMGKSGHIGSKVAATFASTGAPAFFVHPGEASHGDLGMITSKDVVLALSNSGETDEILTILPMIKRLDVPLITLTGNPLSTMAKMATINIDISVAKEACPLGLAPTSSTTATLAMGDALAVSLLEARGFTAEDFARSHPGGRLGRRLLLLIDEIMHSGTDIPVVSETASLSETLVEMTKKGLGMTAVLGADGRLAGVFTDGDLRRVLDRKIDVHETCISELVTRNCRTARPGMLAAEALQLMEKHKINALLVVTDDAELLGAINMHDMLRAGVV